MRKPKIVIIGAGPSGGASALALAMTGRSEVLVLDKSRYPRVKACGSGLSPHALTMLGRLQLRHRFAHGHAKIRGLQAVGPGGGSFHHRAGLEAWVVPRVELDATIVQTAVAYGARFEEETKVVALLRDADDQVRGVKTEAGEIEADLVLCADGSPSRFSRDPSPKTTLRTLVGWWRGGAFPEDEARMIWDERLEGYYAWSFPEPGGLSNVGLVIPENASDAGRLKDLFRDILDRYFSDHLVGAEPVGKWIGHPAVVTTSVGEVGEARALWIGEAARLVSPGTVEGIGFALESGITAARHIDRHFGLQRGFSPLAIRGYRALTSARVVPKFWVGEAFTRAMASPTLRQIGRAVTGGAMRPHLDRALGHFFRGDASHAR